MIQRLAALVILAATLLSQPSQRNDAAAQSKPRARDLGIALDGTPGPLNAITDVQGVEVGYTTLVSGEGKREVGKGPVRTVVTAVLPRGRATLAPVFAAFTIGNGNGDMTGTGLPSFTATESRPPRGRQGLRVPNASTSRSRKIGRISTLDFVIGNRTKPMSI